MIQEIGSLLEETTYAYDGNDNPVSMADGEQRETAVTYDLNRWPVSVAYSGGRVPQQGDAVCAGFPERNA